MVDIFRGLKTNSTGGHHLACLIPVVSGPGLASATGDKRVELSKQSFWQYFRPQHGKTETPSSIKSADLGEKLS